MPVKGYFIECNSETIKIKSKTFLSKFERTLPNTPENFAKAVNYCSHLLNSQDLEAITHRLVAHLKEVKQDVKAKHLASFISSEKLTPEIRFVD